MEQQAKKYFVFGEKEEFPKCKNKGDLFNFNLSPLNYTKEEKAEEEEDQTEKIKNILNELKIDFSFIEKKITFNNIIYKFKINNIKSYKLIKLNNKNIIKYLNCEIIEEQDQIIFKFEKVKKDILYLKNVIKSENKKGLSLNLGIKENGELLNANILDFPHLLIGGTTGSGKSVFLNSLILSICYNFKKEDVSLILVDTKKTEFSVFEKRPNLLFDICYDITSVHFVLDYLINEMKRRYLKFKNEGVKDIKEFNEKHKSKKMNYIIFITDELADLLSYDKNELSSKIVRLAQLSRACGIHLILATQRPSTEVITGTIKANFPSRLCFKVASVYDSRTILDSKGGELLKGNGSAIFKSSKSCDFVKFQAPFIENEKITKIMEELTDE